MGWLSSPSAPRGPPPTSCLPPASPVPPPASACCPWSPGSSLCPDCVTEGTSSAGSPTCSGHTEGPSIIWKGPWCPERGSGGGRVTGLRLRGRALLPAVCSGDVSSVGSPSGAIPPAPPIPASAPSTGRRRGPGCSVSERQRIWGCVWV